jgi:hypothetical protein
MDLTTQLIAVEAELFWELRVASELSGWVLTL